MKTNNFLAIALAALTFVGFSACKNNNQNNPDDPEQEATLALDQTSVTLAVDATATITATVDATWASSDESVATVAGNGKTAVVTAKAAGNTVITATTKGGQTKTCVVLVQNGGSQGGGAGTLKGIHVWPIILDGTTYTANESKIVASFQPNDVDQFLYIWHPEGQPDNVLVYNDGTATGLNFHGNTDGYTALVVAGYGWAGAGFNIQSTTGIAAAEALRAAIVAHPDKYYLHLAMKSTDNYSHCFYFLDSEATKFVIGSSVVYDGPIYQNFTRDGAWHEFDVPMAAYATALSTKSINGDLNLFVMLTEGIAGAQLNIDAVYFYEVE